MQRFQTNSLILRRVNYGEADRIVTLLTEDHGRISVLAKGVRKPHSKLAGGLELFSLSDITVLKGKGNLDHAISTRLKKHYGDQIIRDYDRLQLGYWCNEIIYKRTHEQADGEVFHLLWNTYEALSNLDIPLVIIEAWFSMQLTRILGNQPNLNHDASGAPLSDSEQYGFDVEQGCFMASSRGQFEANDIKAWRLLLSSTPQKINQVSGLADSLTKTAFLLKKFLKYHT